MWTTIGQKTTCGFEVATTLTDYHYPNHCPNHWGAVAVAAEAAVAVIINNRILGFFPYGDSPLYW